MYWKQRSDLEPLSRRSDFEVYRDGDRVLKIPITSSARCRALEIASTAARLPHPNILPVRWEDDALVSAFCPLSLSACVPCSEQRVKGIALSLLDAVEALHGAGLVGIDLKPQHILFREETPLLIDCFTPHSHTLYWMAPEIAQGEAYTAASDLYAVGAILSYMHTCEPVFPCASPSGLWWRLVHDPAPILPGRFSSFLRKALAHNPIDRWQSAAEMYGALLHS